MSLTHADLDRLEALAKAATPGNRTIKYGGSDTGFLVEAPEPLGHFQTWIGSAEEHRDAALWAALDPDTVLALVEAAREKERLLGLLADPLTKVFADHLAEQMRSWMAGREATPDE